jgi:hypothetical protein
LTRKRPIVSRRNERRREPAAVASESSICAKCHA